MKQLGFTFAPDKKPPTEAPKRSGAASEDRPSREESRKTLESLRQKGKQLARALGMPPRPEDVLEDVFARVHRQLKPRTELPEVHVRFRAFANVDSRIRLSADRARLSVSISDVLEDAPGDVLEALAFILIGKLYRREVSDRYELRYRDFVNQPELRETSRQVRRARGRKTVVHPRGRAYDLAAVFDRINAKYFAGKIRRPTLGWSLQPARRALGHYDAAHDAIVVTRLFDDPKVPAYVVEYVMYHEMLHIKHPVEHGGKRRVVHSPAFRREEKSYPDYKRANDWIRAHLR